MESTIDETRLIIATCAARPRCDCVHVMHLLHFHLKNKSAECTVLSTVNVGYVISLILNCHCELNETYKNH